MLLFLGTTADPLAGAASDELDVTLRFLEAAAAASSGKLMRSKTLFLCFRSLAESLTVIAATTALESELGGACGGLLVDDDDSTRR